MFLKRIKKNRKEEIRKDWPNKVLWTEVQKSNKKEELDYQITTSKDYKK